jgi:diphosphomevalonate decarboxylase
MKVTAKANSNIALTKYWGKKNDSLKTPWNSNTSVTLEGLETITTVEFDKKYIVDEFSLDGRVFESESEEFKEVKLQLDLIRKKANISDFAKVVSKNNFPTAAGFASSASGLAALTFAASHAAGLNLSIKELSILSRLGSGSASRSLIDGFAIWHKGSLNDGSDSFAEQIISKEYWPEFRIIGCVVSKDQKKIKSRAGMSQSVKTSPIFKTWVEQADKDALKMVELIKQKDFSNLGKLAQANCILMHSCAMTTDPTIMYWQPKTLEIIHKILDLQNEGKDIYFTIDGGPQVKIICQEKDVEFIKNELTSLGIEKIFICKPGVGPVLINEHLF